MAVKHGPPESNAHDRKEFKPTIHTVRRQKPLQDWSAGRIQNDRAN
jgi:hypothetical protein